MTNAPVTPESDYRAIPKLAPILLIVKSELDVSILKIAGLIGRCSEPIILTDIRKSIIHVLQLSVTSLNS